MKDMNIELEFVKEKSKVSMTSNPRYVSQELGIALKEICLFLKIKSRDSSNYFSEENGYLQIQVTNYKEPLRGDLKAYAACLLYPNQQVTMECRGFSFDEIKQLMQSFYENLPSDCYQYFIYKVNFENLKLGG